jgi:mannose-6-phosphate isomerase-like protein (cupin superfamily)
MAVLADAPDYISPGGASEIRLLIQLPAGEISHARCPTGKVSAAATLDGLWEMFYVLAGRGRLWRSSHDYDGTIALWPGRWAAMPPGTAYQFRAEVEADLVFAVFVTPQWQSKLHHIVEDGAWLVDGEPRGDVAEEAPVSWLDGSLPWAADYLAPDGSEIRLLGAGDRGSVAHCVLAPGATSTPVRHENVHEIWLVTGGHGMLWRQPSGDEDDTVSLRYGVCADIEPGQVFQFRSTGIEPLTSLLLTMPPWPGPLEAERMPHGRW